ncbi:MAG: anaerobic sulfatase maturase [Spirochaetales bacterium]|nr:anaerobic sulfatase maturase [Spirochaetales bacterium]
MAKPVGPQCNLACDYCYYLKKKESLTPGHMTDELLEKYVKQRLELSPDAAHFEWHGGEPTLAGLDFYHKVVRLQKKHTQPRQTVTNGLQTNGVKIDKHWADFLSREGFSVGLSLDGPPDCHNAFRRKAKGGGSFDEVVNAYRLLRERDVFVNVLCVLNARNVNEPDRLWSFFRELEVKYLQFLPYVPPFSVNYPANLAQTNMEPVGDFLCRVFDLWLDGGVGKIVIQTFDEALRPLLGAPHALCVHRPECGDVPVLEHDGGFYACDHFVDPEHLWGNLQNVTLSDLVADPRQVAFGQAKNALPPVCRACDVLEFCHGGCPKDRIDGLNRLCPAYQKIFRHMRPGLTALARHIKTGASLRSFTFTPASYTPK